MVHVHVTDVITIKVLLEVHTILKQSVPLLVAHILYVLVVFTGAVQESVTDVMDVLHTLTVTT